MNKKDLKYGNVVEFRNGEKGLYLKPFSANNMFYLLNNKINLCSFIELVCCNDKLLDKYNNNYDIMKVYEDYTCTKLLWERKEIELTDDEKVILSNIDKKYKYIARDKDGDITIYDTKPHKVFDIWTNTTFDIGHDNDFICLDCYNHLFEFVKWEDDEPYVIEYLLKYCC